MRLETDREERQQRVNTKIEYLLQEIPKFGYNPIRDQVLDQGSIWRPVTRFNYQASLAGKERTYDRDILNDSDGSCTLALTTAEEAILLLQVRPGLKRPYQIELPAGGIEQKVNPLDNVKTELAEEMGIRDGVNPILLGVGPVFAGRSSQETYFYLVRNIQFNSADQRLEPGELILPFTLPIDEILSFITFIMNNRLNPSFPEIGVDPKIMTALILASEYLDKQGEIELARKLLTFN